MADNSSLVYSTDTGRVRPFCNQSAASPPQPSGDGIVHIGRDTKGRKGKGVTTICGLPGDDGALKETAGKLKRFCGSGGSVKAGIIIIQGDHRLALQTELIRQGYRVKLAGG